MREELRRLLNADPFVPFQVTMSSGQSFVIRYPGLVTIGRDVSILARPRSELYSVIRRAQIGSIDTIE